MALFGATALILLALGGWALAVVVFAVMAMVVAHEFGHFITAKRSGMQVTDFFVGFGPVVWSTRVGETRYGVRALLLGGYVKVPGMTWSDQVDPALEARTYRQASYPRKVLFASAGSLMHGVLAVALAWASLSFIGAPDATHVGVAALSQWGSHETPAQVAGLRPGDRLVSIDGVRITSATQLVDLVHHDAGQRLHVVIARGTRTFGIDVTPVDGRHVFVHGQPVATGSRPEGFLGIEVGILNVRSSLLGAVPRAVDQVGSLITTAATSMWHVFSPHEFASLFHQVASPRAANNPHNQLTRPESIVGVVRLAVQSTSTGVGPLIEILMAVNVFVGVLNMLPMLPLDGGYVAIATYERVRSRRQRRYQADVYKLTPVIYAFMGVLLVLFATTLYLDIVHPIANPF